MEDREKRYIGKRWLVANTSGTLCITDGTKPTRSGSGWVCHDETYGWMYPKEGFLILPKITNADEPMEIEIDENFNTTWYRE